jgi:hypothetical protein
MRPEQLAALPLPDDSFVRILGVYLDLPLFGQGWKLQCPQ